MIILDDYKNSLEGKKAKCIDDAFENALLRECARYELNPWFIIAIIEAESSFDPLAIDPPKEHFGLMQLASFYQYDLLVQIGGKDILNPIDNIRCGIYILNLMKEELIKRDLFKGTEEEKNTNLFMAFFLGDVAYDKIKNNEIPEFVKHVINRTNELAKINGWE